MRIPKTAYAVIAATLCIVLLFIVFNTAIVARLVSGVAVDYFVDAARQSLRDTRTQMTAMLSDSTPLDDNAESEILREMLRVSGATGIVVFNTDGSGVYLDTLTGRKARVPAPLAPQSGTAEQTENTAPAQSRPGAIAGNSTGQPAAESLSPALARWLRAGLDTSLEVAPGLPLLEISPETDGGRLLYILAQAAGRTAFLLYTPEALIGSVVQHFPHAEAVVSVNGIILAASGGFSQELEKARQEEKQLTLKALTGRREGTYGITSETLVSSKATGLAVTMLAREVNLLSMLLRDTRFLVATAALLAALAAIIIGYTLYAGKMRKAYRPNKPLSSQQVRRLLRQGEGDHVEFKSTLRFNLKSGKNDKSIELAVLKGITAFLNTAGGTLLVGVSDEGEVLGMDPDGFRNDDHALRHISNLVAEHIGIRHINAISLHALTLDGKTVLAAVCRQATEPAFLRHKDDEMFLVRQGPGNRQLSFSEFWHISRKFR
jgi:uncharacterized protein YneF (UPF0154 family)